MEATAPAAETGMEAPVVLPKHLRPRMAQPVVPATPMIGNFNKKATNTLLVKTELGKVRQTTFNLPGPQHTYGKALFREDEGTGEMIMSWMEHVPNPHARPGRDFKALNKNAVVSGMVTAKQQTDFRKTHDARLKIGTHEDRRFTLADDFIHGKSTRPSTPMVDLISSAYRWSWVAEHLEQEQAAAASPAPKTAVGRPRARSTPKQRSPQALRGAQLMQQAAEPFDPTLSSPAESATVGKKPFVMKRFQKVPPKVTRYLPPKDATGKPAATEDAAGETRAAEPESAPRDATTELAVTTAE